MEEEFTFKATSEQLALNEAMKHFECQADEIKITIVEEAKKIFGKVITPYVFKAEYFKKEEEKIEPELEPELESELESELEPDNESKPESKDGSFSIEYTEEGVKLNLNYPVGEGKAVSIKEITDFINRKNISDVDVIALREAFNFHKESAIIAKQQEEVFINEQAIIHISLDKMEAYATFTSAEGGKTLTFENFLDYIAKEKVVYGFDRENLLTIFRDREYDKEYVIARGLKNVNGEDAKLVLNYEFNKKPKPKLDEEGNVDYFDLDMFISVNEGDVIGQYKNPTKGTPGCDVMGHPVKAFDGKKVKIPLGKNVGMDEDGIHIIAKKKGLLEYTNDRLSVNQILYIDGDVDLSTGNIVFNGNVKIRGSVIPGMTIKAEGTVEVEGTVESSIIEAGENIVLRGGIRGLGKSELKASGNIEARYIENATVVSKACVKSQAIMNSEVECYDLEMPKSSKGLILGGMVRAQHSIICGSLGTERSNTKTIVEVGTSSESRKKLKELETNIKKNTEDIEKIKIVLESTANGKLNAMQRIMVQKLKDDLEARQEELETQKKQAEEITAQLESYKNCFLSVINTAYAGVEISINKASMIVDSPYIRTTFRYLDGEIVISAYEGD